MGILFKIKSYTFCQLHSYASPAALPPPDSFPPYKLVQIYTLPPSRIALSASLCPAVGLVHSLGPWLAVGFRVRRFGVERKPRLATKNPMQTTKPMMTMSDLENYVVDRGFR